MDISTKEGRAATQETLSTARRALAGICDGTRPMRMCVPAQNDDPDLQIAAGLQVATTALRLLDERDAEIEDLKGQRDLHAYACDSAEAEVDLLKVQRDEAERLHNAKCGELHQALVALDRAQEEQHARKSTPSPVTDEMAEVLRETLNDLGNGRVPLVHARAALTAALGRKP